MSNNWIASGSMPSPVRPIASFSLSPLCSFRDDPLRDVSDVFAIFAMSAIQLIVSLLPLAIAALLVLQNQTPTVVVFFGIVSPSLPLGLWAVIAAAIGGMTMWLLSLTLTIRRRGRSPAARAYVDAPPRPDRPDSKPDSPHRRRPRNDSDDREPAEGEIWDEDGEWEDRSRYQSEFAPHLDAPREPWDGPEESSDRSNDDPAAIDPEIDDGFDAASEAASDASKPETNDAVPFDLPPTSRYEQSQEPIETARKGSVYSFSYANKPEERPPAPIDEVGRPEDQRVPLDLPDRDERPQAAPPDPKLDASDSPELDDLEEVTPIIEPPDRSPAEVRADGRRPPRKPRSPDRSRRDPRPRNSERSEDWEEDWRDDERDSEDWI